MRKGIIEIPGMYLKCQKLAEGKYIQNVIVNRKTDMSWVAVNNVSVKLGEWGINNEWSINTRTRCFKKR